MKRTVSALIVLLSLFAAHVAHAAESAAGREEAPCPSAEANSPTVVDLNTADEQTLLALPGIGPARARAILAYRSAHGAFRSVSQLLHIKGIGRSLLRKLRPLVTLSAPPG